MNIERAIVETVLDVDTTMDLSLLHAGITFAAAIAALWVMQCLTRHAGFATGRQVGLMALRASLALLAIGLALNVLFALSHDATPWVMDVICRALTLLALLTVPFALPKHLRAAEHHPAE